MPIVREVPLEKLVSIRRAEYDAFGLYRETIATLIQEQVDSAGTAVTGREIAEQLDDIVAPRLRAMDKKLTDIRSRLSNDLRRDVLATATTVAVGVAAGVVSNQPAGLLAAAGGLPAVKSAVKTALDMLERKINCARIRCSSFGKLPASQNDETSEQR